MNIATLKDCSEFIKDGVHNTPEKISHGVPVLSAGNVNDGRLSFITDRFASFDELAIFRKRLYPKTGDVLLTIVGTIGRTAVILEEKPLIFQRSVCVIRPNKKILDPFYLQFALDSGFVQDQFDKEKQGVAQVGIYLETLYEIKIPLPSLPEQQRIAAILQKADRLRRLRRYARQLSDTYLQSVFLEMFGKSAKTKMLPFVEIAAKEKNSFVNGPFGSNLLTTELVTEGVPVIYIRDIKTGHYERVSKVFVTPQKAKELDMCRVNALDILIAKVGDPPGTAALYPASEPPGVVTQDVIRLKLNPRMIAPEYMVNFLNSELGRQIIKPILVEGTRERFGLTPLKQLPIPIPPLSEQERFANIVNRHDKLRSQIMESSRQAEHLFQSLLRKAFQGEL